MREGYHVKKIAICVFEILSQFFAERDPQVFRVVFAAYICVVEQNFLAVRQVNQTAVGVSQGIECKPVHGRGPPQPDDLTVFWASIAPRFSSITIVSNLCQDMLMFRPEVVADAESRCPSSRRSRVWGCLCDLPRVGPARSFCIG